MARYRKKPVEIEAREVTEQTSQDVADWIEGNGGQVVRHSPAVMHEGGIAATHAFQIKTLEGWMWATFGDYVIQGVAGEFYPIKSAIFEETYESVDGES